MSRPPKLSKDLVETSRALESIVRPAVVFEGDDNGHILDQLIESGDAPEMKAVGYMRMGNTRNNWVSYTITIRGREVIAIDVNEPDLRGIAEEAAKIAFTENFIDAEVVF